MSNAFLEIKNLCVNVGEKEILKNLSFSANKGEVHVIMGPNGAGKSTLANAIMGHPAYKVTSGSICLDGHDITNEAVDKRAKAGIFLSFQNPQEVMGITVDSFLRTAKSAVSGEKVKAFAFHKDARAIREMLDIDKNQGGRYLNVGFSGGEKKKNEIYQMIMLNPKLAILDESDSGLDVDAVRVVSEGINKFRSKDNTIIIITHNANILEKIMPDYAHVIINGKIARSGSAELIEEVSKNGFSALL